MNGKILTVLSVLGWIGASHGSSKDEYLSLEEQVESTKKSVGYEESVLATAQKTFADLKNVEKRVELAAELGKKKTLLEKETKELEASLVATLGQFVEIVKSARKAAVGMEFPELQLDNGKKLIAARITNVSPSEVSFSHSLGITRVPLKGLPEDLKTRFRVGMFPMEKIDEENSRKAQTSTTNAAVEATIPKGAAIPKYSVLQADIAANERQLQSLEQAHKNALTRANPGTAAGSGDPKAKDQADAFQIQITAMKKKIEQLRALLSSAPAG